MDSPVPSNALPCAQCGGELHPDQGQIFLTCPYCAATVYLDKSQVVFHWQLTPTLNEEQARAALRRWMGGNQTVKDLDQKASLQSSVFQYFPIWYFKQRLPAGKEQLLLRPAAATSITELSSLRLPAGDLKKYDPSLDAQAEQPTVPLQAALSWAQEAGDEASQIAERALVHIPLYIFKYAYRGKTFTALVEAATGSVFANLFPAKDEAPFQIVVGLAAVVFLGLASFPVIGVLAGGGGGFGWGLLACTGMGVVAAPLLFALATWVAAKV